MYGGTGDFSFGDWGDDSQKGESTYIYNFGLDIVHNRKSYDARDFTFRKKIQFLNLFKNPINFILGK